jgi:MFS family permease
MNRRSKVDIGLLCVTGFLRSVATGLIGVVLGVYLFRLGFGSLEIGAVTAAGLAGSAVATALMTFRGDRFGRRKSLAWLAFFWGIGGIGLALVSGLPGLLVTVFIGMVNAMGTDRSASYVLEQSVLPGLVDDRDRTWAFSWYHLVLDAGGAIGALGIAIPVALNRWSGIPTVMAYRYLLLGYAALGFVSVLAYRSMSSQD